MGTAQTRQAKIQWLKNKIEVFFKNKPDGAMSKDKLLSAFALEAYSTYRTGEEILRMLEKTGKITLAGDLITK